MSGQLLYAGDHRCDLPGVSPGAIWQCECGTVWRGEPVYGQVWLQVGPIGRWQLRRRGVI